MSQKSQYGDFQTPAALSDQVCDLIASRGFQPRSLIEPTCGKGNFIFSALSRFPALDHIIGFDINRQYVDHLTEKIDCCDYSGSSKIQQRDFFSTDWNAIIQDLEEPILMIGNPPWVTNTDQSKFDSDNLPDKTNFQGLNGFEALTGKSNFDISEWILIFITELLENRDSYIAFLCKTSVARKVMKHRWEIGKSNYRFEIHRIDSNKFFGASVDACLFLAYPDTRLKQECSVFNDISIGSSKMTTLGFMEGSMISDISSRIKYSHLLEDGNRVYQWRSGIKHDCAKVMQLKRKDSGIYNGFDECVKVEDEHVYPILKSSDVANSRISPRYSVIVTQEKIGQDTSRLKTEAPKLWRYLRDHEGYLSSRKSRIYKKNPEFSIFGIGDYSFSPWKVAVSGMYKSMNFTVVPSLEGKPMMLDDTCNFLPCISESEAEFIARILRSKPSRKLLGSFAFWDDQRPLKIGVLKNIDLFRLAEELNVKDQLSEFAESNPYVKSVSKQKEMAL